MAKILISEVGCELSAKCVHTKYFIVDGGEPAATQDLSLKDDLVVSLKKEMDGRIQGNNLNKFNY